jgi:hypothetical protein
MSLDRTKDNSPGLSKPDALVEQPRSRGENVRKASPLIYGEAGYVRVSNDSYFTIDAHRVVPALLNNVNLRGPVFEPSAGMGHLIDALVANGHVATGVDLIDYGHGRNDIRAGVDLFSLSGEILEDYGSVVANLPYSQLDQATAHLLEIAKPLGLQVCSLVRSEWPNANARSALIHVNPFFDRLVVLKRRPRWVLEHKASPRHYFSWVVWDFSRDASKPPVVSFA